MDTTQQKIDARQLLAPFLRYLADNIDTGKMTDEKLQLIGEFYMSYLFAEEVKKDNKIRRKQKHQATEENELKELQKFVCLGWYIYNKILKNETL